MKKLYQAIASALVAHRNCQESGNTEWKDRWAERLERYDSLLPHGSGFDNGSVVVKAESDDTKIVISTSFHHMDENGFYDGWSEHRVTVKPNLLHGISITVSGRDRNGIKDYIHETFDMALNEEIELEEAAA